MANKEPKTQGKIEEIDKKFTYNFPKEFYLWSERGFWLHQVEKALIEQQQALLQRVIELIGEVQDKCKLDNHGGRMSISMPASLAQRYQALTCGKCNTIDQLKSKISQMVKEL